MPQLFKSKAPSSKSDGKSAGGSSSAASAAASSSASAKQSLSQQYQGPPSSPGVYEQYRQQADQQQSIYDGPPEGYPQAELNYPPAGAGGPQAQYQQSGDPRQQLRNSYGSQSGTQTPPAPQEHKKRFRDKFFGQHPSREEHQPTERVGRSSSFRRKQSPSKHAAPAEDPQSRKGNAYWSSRHSSQGNLPNFIEDDEEEAHQRAAQQYQHPHQHLYGQLGQQSPAVPPKDSASGSYYPQQQPLAQGGHQQLHYPPPQTVLRVNTENSPTSQQGTYDYSGSEYSGSRSAHPSGQGQQGYDAHIDNYPAPGQSAQQHRTLQQQQQLSEPPQPPPHGQSFLANLSSQAGEAGALEPGLRNSLQQQQIQAQQQKQYLEQQQHNAQRGSGQQQAPQFPPPPTQAQYQGSSAGSQQEGGREQFPGSNQPPAYQSQVSEIHQPQAIRGALQAQPQRKEAATHLQPPANPQHLAQQIGPPSPLAPGQQSEYAAISPAPPSSSSESLGQQSASVASLSANPQHAQGQGGQHAGDMPSKHSHAQGQGADGYQGQRVQHGAGQQNVPSSRIRGTEMGRSTPPPTINPDVPEDELIASYHQLAKDYKELKEKYTRVKRLYFDKEAQVHTLQNSLAHQRLSQSRTSLDDSEYATRFQRLDGLIAQLSFGIRKDWKSIPTWLQPGCNKDALSIGKQEMTAIGKAFISAWLVDEVFDVHFHPDLDQALSMQLKQIQNNIRLFAPQFQSAEEEDALWAKTMAWRLATLEGLQIELRGPQAHENRQSLIETLNGRLVASLATYLQEPPPPDLAGGVPMIVELAVGIAAHLPMESRDVLIEYFLPGTPLNSEVMKIESGIPPLKEPMAELPDGSAGADGASLLSAASDLKDNSTDDVGGLSQAQAQQQQQAGKDKPRGMLAGIMGTRKAPPSAGGAGLQGQQGGPGGSASQQQQQQPPGSSGGPKDEGGPPRVRMAVGLAVQVRGKKNVLAKASIYSA